MSQRRKWSVQEDSRLMRQVAAFPQNLAKCFTIVAEELDRTPSAVANHWYTKVSKDPMNVAFFTASQHHVSKNRKNGEGIESNMNIWRRLMRIIKSL
jgi:hypothetical protein